MSSRRLQSPLHHSSVPGSSARPAPLWQIAAALDPAAGRVDEEERRPLTSAVLAGWVCVGCGLLTAWFFPLTHVFFSVSIVLSVVALATHQVRAGLALLAGSLAGIGLCAILFVVGLAALVGGALHAATTRSGIAPASAASFATPPGQWSCTAPIARHTFTADPADDPARTTNVRPLPLDEIIALLGAGRRDDQIVAATAGRPLSGWMGQTEITNLRVYGAGERLIDDLRARPVLGNSPRPPAVFPSTPAMRAVPDTRAATVYAAPPPVDYQARDRQIENLKSQINTLDEQIRLIRSNPNDYRYRWHYPSSRFNGIDQSAYDAYLKELDRQRNDLRRQKWALEGR